MKRPISEATLGMGMGAGLVTYIYAFNIVIHYGPTELRVVFGAGAIAGGACFIIWARQLETRCALYARVLREQGISPPTVS
jgi:hypothetical protein